MRWASLFSGLFMAFLSLEINHFCHFIPRPTPFRYLL
ncbi:hypothetical protein EPIR_3082 [Erwinia piriflorinigrans CFBP 5888]|uniref:Uncharacterized protein n=1 Tax=Erwinia piriflorinigrans CFBP 5888 TaxID=1161919 RepID=V5ZB06_9GAMM|nr:hypothetical protein EPIR_3082 [Erwinia piriflorinigrans CFBP 5888]